jgi:hypothetical protein
VTERRNTSGPLPFADYDQRKYRTLDVREGYAIWSTVYGELDDRFDLELLEASPGDSLASRRRYQALIRVVHFHLLFRKVERNGQPAIGDPMGPDRRS